MWVSSLEASRLTLVWGRHDRAGLERLAPAWRSRSLLPPYGTTGVATCGGALLI